jgi:pimeloyl-ACP methyl ester carboxylesterase
MYLFFPESKNIQAKPGLVLSVDNFLWRLGSGEMTARSLAQQLDADHKEIALILNQYLKAGILTRRMGRPCPNDSCTVGVIWEDKFGSDTCDICGAELTDEWRALAPEEHFEINRSGRTFPPWMLLIHGMNTRGEWQQRVAFIQGLMGETSPICIYKYGIKRIEPFFGFLQNSRLSQFLLKYRQARELARRNGLDEPPDVIAHSFGTLIIGNALRKDPSVTFGKILLCGSILPPDFEWSQFIEKDRVEMVLNHIGGKDSWARIAVRAIPHSGPSGRIGFLESPSNRDRMFNVLYRDYGHSDFFKEELYDNHFMAVWRPFFWGKLDELGNTVNLHKGAAKWVRPSFCARAPFLTWLMVLLLLLGSCLIRALVLRIV